MSSDTDCFSMGLMKIMTKKTPTANGNFIRSKSHSLTTRTVNLFKSASFSSYDGKQLKRVNTFTHDDNSEWTLEQIKDDLILDVENLQLKIPKYDNTLPKSILKRPSSAQYPKFKTRPILTFRESVEIEEIERNSCEQTNFEAIFDISPTGSLETFKTTSVDELSTTPDMYFESIASQSDCQKKSSDTHSQDTLYEISDVGTIESSGFNSGFDSSSNILKPPSLKLDRKTSFIENIQGNSTFSDIESLYSVYPRDSARCSDITKLDIII